MRGAAVEGGDGSEDVVSGDCVGEGVGHAHFTRGGAAQTSWEPKRLVIGELILLSHLSERHLENRNGFSDFVLKTLVTTRCLG